jgi:AcrR family transcriptional regulator
VTTTKARTKRGSTRSNMLVSAAEVMRERGAAGVTIDEVLARSGAPRGSVYYHFPEGRNQILVEALQWAGDTIAESIDAAADRGAMPLVRGFAEFWERTLVESDFGAGCPVVAAAIGCTDDEARLPAIASTIFGRWRDALARAFVSDGFEAAEAESLALTCIASLEGAVVLCRSIRNAEPLRQVACQMEFLVKSREFVRRHGLPTVDG